MRRPLVWASRGFWVAAFVACVLFGGAWLSQQKGPDRRPRVRVMVLDEFGDLRYSREAWRCSETWGNGVRVEWYDGLELRAGLVYGPTVLCVPLGEVQP